MTHEEAVGFLQESGWLQDHDRQIYEQGKRDGIEERNNRDMVSRSDVVSICNILADKMDDEGRVAVEQVRDAVKDMRPYEGSDME